MVDFTFKLNYLPNKCVHLKSVILSLNLPVGCHHIAKTKRITIHRNSDIVIEESLQVECCSAGQ